MGCRTRFYLYNYDTHKNLRATARFSAQMRSLLMVNLDVHIDIAAEFRGN